jgi:RNA polymerase-binding transcription factor DksA
VIPPVNQEGAPEPPQAVTNATVVDASFDDEKPVGIHIRLPGDVYRELKAESKVQRMLMTEYCRMLIVKRPVKVENVIPNEARLALARIPKLEASLAKMTENWNSRKEKYTALEATHKKLIADFATLKQDNASLAHQRDVLKRRLDDVLKQSTKVECPGCGEEIAIDFADEKAVLKQSGSPKH